MFPASILVYLLAFKVSKGCAPPGGGGGWERAHPVSFRAGGSRAVPEAFLLFSLLIPPGGEADQQRKRDGGGRLIRSNREGIVGQLPLTFDRRKLPHISTQTGPIAWTGCIPGAPPYV